MPQKYKCVSVNERTSVAFNYIYRLVHINICGKTELSSLKKLGWETSPHPNVLRPESYSSAASYISCLLWLKKGEAWSWIAYSFPHGFWGL